MAFPVPDHLPKRSTPVDVSSKILYKIDSATNLGLNSNLASSWIHELDDSIREAERHIHDRIQSELPLFQHQLETSKSIQSRFGALQSRVDELGNGLSDPKSGLLPTLVSVLQKHSVLAQETNDASTIYQSWSYLLNCKTTYTSILSFVQQGKLPEAAKEINKADDLIDGIPDFLKRTQVVADLKKKYNATKARAQDQLSDAYSRAVIISPTEMTIHPFVQVRQSETVLQLTPILCSLSPPSLGDHLSTLRRDLITHFVDHVLKQPYTLSIKSSIGNEAKLSLIPAPPNSEDLKARLDNVSAILNFLSSYLFPNLPPHEGSQFKRTLIKPVTISVLQNLLMPSLPSSFGLLPSYLNLLTRAVKFEEDVGRLSENGIHDGSIKAWFDGASGHYERRRRIEILELARQQILSLDDSKNTFEAFSEGGPETSLPTVIPVQPDGDFKDDAWGFDEPITANPIDESGDSWGFDDDLNAEPTPEEESIEENADSTTPIDVKFGEAKPEPAEPDPAEAWGWNDDDELPTADVPDDNPWDDPWSDTPADDPSPEPSRPSISASVKAATRLEKLASKNKKQMNGHTEPSVSPTNAPPVSSSTSSPPKPETSFTIPSHSSLLNRTKRPSEVITTIVPKEVYKVPKRAKRVLKMVETVIDESKLFYASNLFPPSKGSVSEPGAILVQSASSIVELYQALYPVKFSKELESPEQGMLFSNSCLYMTGSIQRLEDSIYGQPALKERLTECRKRLQSMGDSWFEETIERQQVKVNQILIEGAQSFRYIGDQDRYDDCEAAVNECLKYIKRVASSLKGVLTKSKYYSTIGAITDAALSQILHDVLALSDIPELDSHRISELCRILTALEGLFISDNLDEPSFVVQYVPNWLKFSYLSELLEASLADITYLFEQGALVDFQIDELVNLVRSLFADTSLRTNTINKILSGQPVSQQ